MLTIVDAKDAAGLRPTLLKRQDTDSYEQMNAVREIVDAVEKEGDDALFRFTRKFDHFDVTPENICVTEDEIQAAYSEIPSSVRNALIEAAANIEAFHRHQRREDWYLERPDGSFVGQLYLPVASAGVYVPGGTAAYPSSVLMNIIPARCANVDNIYVATPAVHGKVNPATIIAAHIAGADVIYKIGGAQAIAALAFGTQSVARADVIAGPGNIYVALAKRLLYGRVGIDMIAGPSEIAVLADENARPDFIAADLLSQAEHDVLAACVLVTPSEKLIENVNVEIEEQIASLPRKEIAEKSLATFGTAVLCEDLKQCCKVVNDIAPEHLEIVTENPQTLLFDIRHAGSIFLGSFSPEPLGDYFAGTNHVLPTNGTARFSSPLNVDNFQKKSSVIYYTREEMEKAAPSIALLARAEGLEAHARSAEMRIAEEGKS